MSVIKRLILDINWSGYIGGHTDRYCLFSWNDFGQMMQQRNAQAALYNPPTNPNWRQPPKPRIHVIYAN